MQLLAMITMLIDHIGYVWFPQEATWRIIGRIAMPLYAYLIVVGYSRTRNIKRYLARTGLLALLSQIPYTLAFNASEFHFKDINGYEINAIGTLFGCLLALFLMDRLKGKWPLQLLMLASMTVLMEIVPFDYGAYALLLVLIYRYASPPVMAVLHLALNIAAIFFKGWGWTLQLFSLFPTLLIVYMPDLMSMLDKPRVPRLLWRSFYPAHLAAIAIVYYAMNGHFR